LKKATVGGSMKIRGSGLALKKANFARYGEVNDFQH